MTIDQIKLVLLNEDSDSVKIALSNFDINSIDANGNNILFYFIRSRNDFKHSISVTDFFKELDKYKFDFNARQTKTFKRTPIAFSVFWQDKEVFDQLLKRKVDLRISDTNGNSPLFDAIVKYKNEESGYFIQTLLKNGADKDQKNAHGVTPYKLANTIANTNVKSFFN